MVAELGSTMAAAPAPVQSAIGHEGVVNVTINLDSVKQLMDGAQGGLFGSQGRHGH